MSYIPESSLTPPEEFYISADCGHEVYDGEVMIKWPDVRRVKTLCPDCFRDKLGEMSTQELAVHFGCDYTTVVRADP